MQSVFKKGLGVLATRTSLRSHNGVIGSNNVRILKRVVATDAMQVPPAEREFFFISWLLLLSVWYIFYRTFLSFFRHLAAAVVLTSGDSHTQFFFHFIDYSFTFARVNVCVFGCVSCSIGRSCLRILLVGRGRSEERMEVQGAYAAGIFLRGSLRGRHNDERRLGQRVRHLPSETLQRRTQNKASPRHLGWVAINVHVLRSWSWRWTNECLSNIAKVLVGVHWACWESFTPTNSTLRVTTARERRR